MPRSRVCRTMTALGCAALVASVLGVRSARAGDSAGMHLRVFALANHANTVASYRDLWSETWRTGIGYHSVDSLGLGAGLEWPLGGRLSVGAELTLVRKGWQLEGESWKHLRYAEVPLLLRLNVAGSDRGAALYLLGGGSLAFYLSGETSTAGTTAPVDNAEVASSDLALVGGAGLRLPLSRLSPFAEIRLQEGLKDVQQSASQRARNVGVALVAGVRF
jgi:hypothetical protein